MSGNIIPSWNSQGVLPPIDPNTPTSRSRSPYRVSLNDFVSQFGTSSHRQNLLNGLLSFRSALYGAGIISGFQWLDGSFLECVESLRSCPPNDIDVVTFYIVPAGQTQQTLEASNPQLFDHDSIKNSYHADAYFFELKGSTIRKLISESTYWYSLWSHQRNSLLWKGYLQIDLSPTDDHIALDSLNRIRNQGGSP
ncbi:Uncharacterised protein [uncultured archaeon]|nr:Uncharacterised protein [uncultured archaeon]